MPRYTSQRSSDSTGWFEKLPHKLQIVLLMLITLLGAAIAGGMGIYTLRTGKPLYVRHHEITWTESFFWCAIWLAIFGGLFAVFMGWARSSKQVD